MSKIDAITSQILLLRCQRGDTAAWSKLVRSHADLVYSIARRSGLSKDEAEDVFQQTFFALYKSLNNIEDGSRLAKWISVTASREAIRVSKSRTKSVDLGESNELLDDLIQSDERSAEDLLIKSRQIELALRGIEDLAEACRNLLNELFAEEPRPYEDIAESLSIPIGAIGPTRARCIEKLRRILIKFGFFDNENVSRLDRRSLKELSDAKTAK